MTDAAQVQRFEVVADGQRLVRQAALGQPSDAQLPGEVDQGQGVAACRRDDLGGCRRVDRLRKGRTQQPHRPLCFQTGETQHRHARDVGVEVWAVAGSHDDGNCLGLEAARHQPEDVQRLGVQQVCVVHDAHDRLDLTRGGQETEDSQPDHEPVGRRSVSHARGDAYRLLVTFRQRRHVVAQRDGQPLDAGERDRGLGLETINLQQAHPSGVGRRGVQQRRLADARLAREQHGAAAAVACMPQKGPYPLLLGPAAEESPPALHRADSSDMKLAVASANWAMLDPEGNEFDIHQAGAPRVGSGTGCRLPGGVR